MKLKRNALGGLMVPVNSIGAAHKTKREPRDELCIGLRLGSGQLNLWLNCWRYSDKPVAGPISFSQWYDARKK